MSGFLSTLSSGIDTLHNSAEPYDLHGGKPVPGPLQKGIADLENYIEHGPPFTLADLVSALFDRLLHAYATTACIYRCSKELDHRWHR